jgi:hypothetical protein
MSLFAIVTGSAGIHAQTHAFTAALVRRIEAGVLPNAPARRRRYVLTRNERDGLGFRAADWLTAFYVGLNDVDMTVAGDRRVNYVIRYQRWAGYALALSALIGLALMAWLLLFDGRGYIETHPASRLPGLSTDQSLAIAWGMAVFWGFVWPWILIALHKRPLRRLMDQIIGEVDADAMKATT